MDSIANIPVKPSTSCINRPNEYIEETYLSVLWSPCICVHRVVYVCVFVCCRLSLSLLDCVSVFVFVCVLVRMCLCDFGSLSSISYLICMHLGGGGFKWCLQKV